MAKYVCPVCGSHNLTKIDRMNGYLAYSRVHGDTRLNSAKMAEIAENKFRQSNITVICGDVEEMNCTEPFDCAVVYNAFPHFTNPDRLIKKLSEMVKVGGTVTVAHGMSRKMIDHHHSGAASKVSAGLMSEDELAEIFSKYLKVIIKISDDNMYQVTGIKE